MQMFVSDVCLFAGACWCLTCEQVELLVQLQQLEGAPGSPSFFFGQTIVDVALVFGGASHADLCQSHSGKFLNFTPISAAHAPLITLNWRESDLRDSNTHRLCETLISSQVKVENEEQARNRKYFVLLAAKDARSRGRTPRCGRSACSKILSPVVCKVATRCQYTSLFLLNWIVFPPTLLTNISLTKYHSDFIQSGL